LLLLNMLRHMKSRFNGNDLRLSNYRDMSSHHSTILQSSKEFRVSVIIPTRDKPDLLASCIQSLRGKTKYSNIELIIIDNDSVLPETRVLLEELRTQGATVLDYKGTFNYSAICNFATEHATGEYLCFLNNDTETLSPEWLSSMVDHAVQPDTGIVGSVLLYPDGSIQHMGIALGYNFVAGHPSRGEAAHKNIPDGCYQVSAVTFAAAVISKRKFNLIGRLDDSLPSGFNDVDISIRARALGFRNIVCVHSTLTHHESQTRLRARSIKGVIRVIFDSLAFLKKHPAYLSDDYFS
jgi:GT2 family glycosyltransferase